MPDNKLHFKPNCLGKELWDQILKHVTAMEDVCSFAMVNAYYYKVGGNDFKKLCLENAIFRLKNETWAYAFKRAGYRGPFPPSELKHYAFCDSSICCPYTGKMAVIVRLAHVLITNIDFSSKEYQLLDFTEYNYVSKVQITNRGKQMIVDTYRAYIVYDLTKNSIVRVYEAERSDRYISKYTIYRNGVLTDVLNQKEFAVCAKSYWINIKKVNNYGIRKYIGYVSEDNRFVLIETSTGREMALCEITREGIWVDIDDDSDSLVIRRRKFRLFDIRTQTSIIDVDLTSTRHHLTSIQCIYSIHLKNFICYNNRKKRWEDLGHFPYISVKPIMYCGTDFVLPMMSLYEAWKEISEVKYAPYVFYLDFSKSKIQAKTVVNVKSEERGKIHKLCDITVEDGDDAASIKKKFKETIDYITRSEVSNSC
ncbi:unnamed protein product [Bursaphelenchus okinawaensis]|uniref:Uncharacterized protein n=1 Tax=Bursaphelenchus okinawaensis TaxID=465554 RepID=A0A811K9W7_9BILA|nr:unnamed protein product [Bursaphelenchus okinawaensis]CAG9095473.1 unnamed protein product [Bursaphelenchus okinawaensis]